mgnify:CR=1 FL=1
MGVRCLVPVGCRLLPCVPVCSPRDALREMLSATELPEQVLGPASTGFGHAGHDLRQDPSRCLTQRPLVLTPHTYTGACTTLDVICVGLCGQRCPTMFSPTLPRARAPLPHLLLYMGLTVPEVVSASMLARGVPLSAVLWALAFPSMPPLRGSERLLLIRSSVFWYDSIIGKGFGLVF